MKTPILNIYGMLILLGLYACSDNSDMANDKKLLVDVTWDLQSFEVVGVEESAIGSQGIILIFIEDNSLEGEAYRIYGDPDVPGNSYGGVYEVGLDDSLSIKQTYTTLVGLPAGSRYTEYFQALRNASAYEIKGVKLRIFYDGRTKALNFRAE